MLTPLHLLLINTVLLCVRASFAVIFVIFFLKIDNAEKNLSLPLAYCHMAISADSLQLTYLSSSPLNSLTDLIISKQVSHLTFGSMALLENLQSYILI